MIRYVSKPLKATQMTEALKEALTPNRSARVWDYIKDHPHTTATSVALALEMQPNNVSSVASSMVARGMLKEKVEMGLDAKGVKRKLHFYTASIKKYAVLPMPKKAAVEPAPTPVPVPEIEVPVQLAAPAPTLEEKVATIVDALTIREAVAVYAALHKLLKE